MKQAVRQIVFCALALILFCVVCRLTMFRTYTAHIPVHPYEGEEGLVPRLQMEGPDVAHLGEAVLHKGMLRVPVYPDKAGAADLHVLDQNGEEIGLFVLHVGRFGTVYDWQTGGFTGDTAVLIAVTLFWLAVCAIMAWHFSRAKGPAFYAYSTIYFAGFSLFALATGLLMLRVTLSHILHPEEFSMLSAYSTINGASTQFMMLTMPVMVVFAVAMAISNVALLRHERVMMKNALGLVVSGLLIVGEAVGFLLFFRDFSGSEWEGRIQKTLENVYATVFVYFECMLVGSAICGVKAAKHKPVSDKDFLLILGSGPGFLAAAKGANRKRGPFDPLGRSGKQRDHAGGGGHAAVFAGPGDPAGSHPRGGSIKKHLSEYGFLQKDCGGNQPGGKGAVCHHQLSCVPQRPVGQSGGPARRRDRQQDQMVVLAQCLYAGMRGSAAASMEAGDPAAGHFDFVLRRIVHGAGVKETEHEKIAAALMCFGRICLPLPGVDGRTLDPRFRCCGGCKQRLYRDGHDHLSGRLYPGRGGKKPGKTHRLYQADRKTRIRVSHAESPHTDAER